MTVLTLPETATAVRARMRALADQRFSASMDLPTRFFDTHADAVSRACLGMARRFQRGGRLLVFGDAAAATDAQHVAVEFVHPVLVGKRALPAISLSSGGGADFSTAARDSSDAGYSRALAILGRDSDIALGIAASSSASIVPTLASARTAGMLTIALCGADALAANPRADHVFVVPSTDSMLVQEVHEMLYHVLWELVHVFLDGGATE